MASTAAAGAEDCHNWEKMQSSAAQRPGSAAAVLTKAHSQPHAQAVGWNPVLGHGNCRCLPVQKTAMTGRNAVLRRPTEMFSCGCAQSTLLAASSTGAAVSWN
jgi:hypothetical protein